MMVASSNHRPWCIPAAVLREPGETLEGLQVLHEHPDHVAVVLWRVLRNVTLWAAVEPEARAGLFRPGAAQVLLAQRDVVADPLVELALTTLASVAAEPEAAHSGAVTEACMAVSRWAAGRGTMNTAIAFAQAGALASPEDAAAALTVGQLTLQADRFARAETWLRRSIRLGSRTRDWYSYGMALAALGGIYARRGQPEAARRFFIGACRIGKRKSLREPRGAGMHGLMRLAMDPAGRGDRREALRFARIAVKAYGVGHPRARDLLHDVAELYVLVGEHNRALPLLQRLLPWRSGPAERALTLALQARSAAGTGASRLYEQSWSTAWAEGQRPSVPGANGRVFLHLACAAALRKDWLRVQQALPGAGRRGAELILPTDAIAVEFQELGPEIFATQRTPLPQGIGSN